MGALFAWECKVQSAKCKGKTTHVRCLRASIHSAEIPDQVRNDGIRKVLYRSVKHPDEALPFSRHPELVSGSLLSVSSLPRVEIG